MINTIKQKTVILATNRMVSILMIALIFATVLTYVYLANTTVRTLTSLEKTKKQMQSLSVDVSEMESQRLVFENNINVKKALSLGFVEVNNPSFILRNSGTASLSMKIN